MEDPAKCLIPATILSDEALDHVKRMCGPGYALDGNGNPQPIEPETEARALSPTPEAPAALHSCGAQIGAKRRQAAIDNRCWQGSTMAKGPGFFIQPHTLPPGTGVEGYFGDDSATLPEDDVAFLCKAVEDDQAEIKKACINYFLAFFKAVDEEGKGVLVGDAFKTVIGKLEEDMPMEAKEAPWMTPKAAQLIEEAGAEGDRRLRQVPVRGAGEPPR